uniref:(northern house mosquito) hypothetical protein n=1 Tax=Culex pipiens TaxID=7175 RepID=A0A8D8BLI7_CULPI
MLIATALGLVVPCNGLQPFRLPLRCCKVFLLLKLTTFKNVRHARVQRRQLRISLFQQVLLSARIQLVAGLRGHPLLLGRLLRRSLPGPLNLRLLSSHNTLVTPRPIPARVVLLLIFINLCRLLPVGFRPTLLLFVPLPRQPFVLAGGKVRSTFLHLTLEIVVTVGRRCGHLLLHGHAAAGAVHYDGKN